jgi:Na+-driven multidrug efflux pump
MSMVLNTVRLFAFYVLGAVIGLQLDGVRGLLIGAALGNLMAGGIVWWLMRRMQSRGELSFGFFQLSLDRISRH